MIIRTAKAYSNSVWAPLMCLKTE